MLILPSTDELILSSCNMFPQLRLVTVIALSWMYFNAWLINDIGTVNCRVKRCQDWILSRIHDPDLSLQTISLLVYMSGALGRKGPFLVLSPLSVMENWRRELEWYNHIHI